MVLCSSGGSGFVRSCVLDARRGEGEVLFDVYAASQVRRVGARLCTPNKATLGKKFIE